jgi:hypothetical protein
VSRGLTNRMTGKVGMHEWGSSSLTELCPVDIVYLFCGPTVPPEDVTSRLGVAISQLAVMYGRMGGESR